MPGNLGLPAGTPQGLDAADPDSSGATGVSLVNATVHSFGALDATQTSAGGTVTIPETQGGNTLFIDTFQWQEQDPDPLDGSIPWTPIGPGGGNGQYYIKNIPGGETSVVWTSFAPKVVFVYELSPCDLDDYVSETKSATGTHAVISSSIAVKDGDFAFYWINASALTGPIGFPTYSDNGWTADFPWQTYAVTAAHEGFGHGYRSDPTDPATYDYTVDWVSATTIIIGSQVYVTSFKSTAGSGGGGPPPPPDTETDLPNSWITC